MRPAAGSIAAAALLLLSARAAAQEVPAVNEGTRVWVTTVDGREQEGRVDSVSSTEVALRIGTTVQSIPMPTVRQIQTRDALINGMLYGAIAGGATLGGFGALLSHALCEVPDGCFPQDLPPILIVTGMGAGIGIAAGALVDYLIDGRRTVYSAGSPVVLRVDPRLGPGVAGFRLSVTWGR